MLNRLLFGLYFFLFFPLASQALVFPLPENGHSLVGNVQSYVINPNENFYEVSRKFDIGFEALVQANPQVDYMKREKPQEIVIPSKIMLPPVPWKGIVINIAEMRLYYFPENSKQVYIFPVGVGVQGWSTPTGTTRVIQRIKNPTWHIPDSIRESAASNGTYYPDVVEPGPLDPLGNFALRLNIPGYLIHGTIDPNSIGARSSSGCIRLYPEDIETLYNLVATKTPVRLINQPYKLNVENSMLYLEAHPPMDNNELRRISDVTPLLQSAVKENQQFRALLDWKLAAKIALEHSGVPQMVGKAEMLQGEQLPVQEMNVSPAKSTNQHSDTLPDAKIEKTTHPHLPDEK